LDKKETLFSERRVKDAIFNDVLVTQRYTIKELNKYLTDFEPIFTENEVDRILQYLIRIQN
jgi:hypothetical protein